MLHLRAVEGSWPGAACEPRDRRAKRDDRVVGEVAHFDEGQGSLNREP